jgi:dihydrofolate reductase
LPVAPALAPPLRRRRRRFYGAARWKALRVTDAAALKEGTVAKLIYSAITSLDGYVADEDGGFNWAAPDEEVHAFVNDLERPVGTYLYGRGMYETMAVWETMDLTGEPLVVADFAQLWRVAEKIVYSTTLDRVDTARTRLEHSFEADDVRRLKETAVRDLGIGGPGLATQALKAGLVDECHLFVTPVAVGGGTPALPRHARLTLALLGERRFAGGVVHLHYRVVA